MSKLIARVQVLAQLILENKKKTKKLSGTWFSFLFDATPTKIRKCCSPLNLPKANKQNKIDTKKGKPCH